MLDRFIALSLLCLATQAFAMRPICRVSLNQVAYEAMLRGAARGARAARDLEIRLADIAAVKPYDHARLEKMLRAEIANSPSREMLAKLIVAFDRSKSDWGASYWQDMAKIDQMEKLFLAAHERLVPKSAELDKAYGVLRLPALLKDHEMSATGLVKNPTVQILDPKLKDQKLGALDTAKEYSWIIDAQGRLVIGEEYDLGNRNSLGHPTLVDGGFGRIAGDMHFVKGEWVISQKSARYSMGKGRKEPHLNNVGKLFDQFGTKVKVEFNDLFDF